MDIKEQFTTVTHFSKTVALLLLIFLPFIGFYVGIKYQMGVTLPPPPIIFLPSVRQSNIQGMKNLSALNIMVNNSVAKGFYAILIDPFGRVTGIGSDGKIQENIPNSTSFIDTIGKDAASTPPIEQAQTITISAPSNGIYQLQIVGSLGKTYSIFINGRTINNIPLNHISLSGKIQKDIASIYKFSYNSEPGGNINITQEPTK